MRFKDDYAAAGVPMLPVVAEPPESRGRWCVLLGDGWRCRCCWSLSRRPAGYAVAAALLGGAFLVEAHRLQGRAPPWAHRVSALGAMRLFHGSISYLTLLFVAVALDPLLRW
jgi:protoheme IX farnesyltransferase